MSKPKKHQGPRVLIYDIETAPILGYVWDLWDQNVGLNQIKADWHILSWSAKWLGDKPSQTMYMDQRNAKNVEDDKKMLEGIWKLLDEADVVITQNGKKFDQKKLNARFILNGMKKPSPSRHIDTLQIAKSQFAFTSNKLEYMTDKLCTKYKKLKHSKFAGFEMWKQCLAGNIAAWKEMEKYNRYDVLSLEELYLKLQPWAIGANHVDFNVYNPYADRVCNCGSNRFLSKGYTYTTAGKFKRLICKDCGTSHTTKQNELTKEKRKSLMGE